MNDKKLTWLDIFLLFPVGLVFTVSILLIVISVIKLIMISTWVQLIAYGFLAWFIIGVFYMVFRDL